ncbi:MAG TPA: hypothetical protein VFK84_13050 [Burkholderiales bacterium]|nr:hypothetical protein [Burkholderiales bacterium]
MQPMQATVADNSITRTLARALRTVGSLQRLAEHLEVSPELLTDWLEGRREPPTRVYMRALDLVAGGPFTRRKH